MPFADHHDMVKAFPSHRSNHALCIGVLPGRAWRNDRLSFAKTSAREVVDLSALIRTQSESRITLLLHLVRLLPFLLGGHRQLALENLALRHQLAVYKKAVTRPMGGLDLASDGG